MSKNGFALAAAVVIGIATSSAEAGFVPSWRQSTYSRVLGATIYTYDLYFAAGDREYLAPGNTLTLYDVFDPNLSAFSGTMPAYISATTSLLTPPPTGTVTIDSPQLANITFTYTAGFIRTGDTLFTVDLNLAGNWMGRSVQTGTYASTAQTPFGPISQIGQAPLPAAIPEPACLGLIASLAVGLRRLRRQQA